jgi:hypothetical protein
MNKSTKLKTLKLLPNHILSNKIDKLSKKILNFTPQLYHLEKDHRDLIPKPLGSSILIKSEKFYYLVSASIPFNI